MHPFLLAAAAVLNMATPIAEVDPARDATPHAAFPVDERWAALVPELLCTDLDASLAFYRDVVGFRVRFERAEDGFVYLEFGRAQLMLEEVGPESWRTAALVRPFGRGINLQIEVDALAPLHRRLSAAGIRLFREPHESRYREGDIEHRQIELLVQDPDGYLLRFVEILPDRPFPAR